MRSAIKKLSEGNDLTVEEAKRVMEILLSGEATQSQIGAVLTALRMKGETIDEIAGFASVLGQKAEHITPKCERYVDLVGTGGDGASTFNISTTAAFVVAAAGLPVAKHGNRAISSKSGAGDVLEELGVKINADPDVVEKCVEETGIGFMFAQTFNKSMRFVGQARSEMGIRTVFNILGPLANPSNAKAMVVGVYDPKLTEKIAGAMKMMGVERAFVVSSEEGMDEISVCSATRVSEIKDGKVVSFKITPEEFGFKRAEQEDIVGGDASVNAQITRDILSGKLEGPKKDIVLLNAGATLYVGGIAASMEEGIELAKKTLESGAAAKKLEELIIRSNA